MTQRSESQPAGVTRIELPDGSAYLLATAGSSDHVRGVLDGITEMRLTIARDVARRKGFGDYPQLEELLQRKAAAFRERFAREKRAHGIAPQIVKLLGAVSKREAERQAANLVITAEEFADFIFNAHAQLGYRHRMKWRTFLPDHLEGVSAEVSQAMRDVRPGPASHEVNKAMRKVRAIFDERKRVHVHMLERGAKWHCFFFDLNDVSDADHGPHLHYISHRWPINREVVWADFDERRQSIPRGVHIRYADPRLDLAAASRRRSTGKLLGGYVLHVTPAPDADLVEDE